PPTHHTPLTHALPHSIDRRPPVSSPAAARRRANGRRPSRGSLAAHWSWSLLEHLLHAKELAVAPALRRVGEGVIPREPGTDLVLDRKSTRLNSSHGSI